MLQMLSCFCFKAIWFNTVVCVKLWVCLSKYLYSTVDTLIDLCMYAYMHVCGRFVKNDQGLLHAGIHLRMYKLLSWNHNSHSHTEYYPLRAKRDFTVLTYVGLKFLMPWYTRTVLMMPLISSQLNELPSLRDSQTRKWVTDVSHTTLCCSNN